MKAVYQDRYGLSDVLQFKDVEHPTVGEREVLVRVTAAGMDPGVWHLMTGMPYAVRLMGYGFRAPKYRIRGRDLAGVVEAVGSKVTKFKAGDEVFGVAEGTFAEYVSAKETALARKPANLTLEQASALAISAFTAVQALRKAQLQSGHKVLVLGAAGGVGSFAVQLAKHHGAHVTGVCSTSKVDFVHTLGADDVIDYTREELTGEHDIVLDCAGNRSLAKLRRVLKPNGTLVMVGGERGGRILGGMDRIVRAALLSMFIGQHLRGIFAAESPEDLELIRDLAEQGAITPAIDRTYPLNAVPEAIDHVQKGRVRGKVVITV